MTSLDLKPLLLQFATADHCRHFNFSSGHVGALPIQGLALMRLLNQEAGGGKDLLPGLLLKASLTLLLQSLFPIKHAGLVARTILRWRNGKGAAPVHALSVISLGTHPPERDAYLGLLLAQLKPSLNYLTIAGGNCTKSGNCQLIETVLSCRHIAWLCMTIPFQTPLLVYRLARGGLRIKNWRARMIFLLFGLREINSGGALTQQIVAWAVSDHLKTGAVRTLLFPMEGRNWEKRIVRVANGWQIRSIGYLHCALTPRHLSLLDRRFIAPDERPSRIVAPSEMAYGLLQKAYDNIVHKGYFLRGASACEVVSPEQECLLFALIGDVAESELIIKQVANLQDRLGKQLLIRLNPNTASYPHLKVLALGLGLTLHDPQNPIAPEICFFRSSSVAIEYLKQNVRSVYLALDEPVSNNIFELDNKFGVESVYVDAFFGDNIELLASHHVGNRGFDGKVIATYYLDEDFVASDLPRTIL